MADNASTAGPKSTFEAYRAEGDMLFKQQDFKKALESYDQVSIVLDNFHSSHLWLTIGYYVYVCTHSQFKSKTLTWQNNIVSLQSKYSKIHSFHSSIALIVLRMSTLFFDFSMAFVVHSCLVKAFSTAYCHQIWFFLVFNQCKDCYPVWFMHVRWYHLQPCRIWHTCSCTSMCKWRYYICT